MNGIRSSSDVELIRRLREELCDTFGDRVIPTYIEYVEWEQLDQEGSPDELAEFFGSDVPEEFSRFSHWLSVMNDPTFLSGPMNFARYIVTKRTFRPLIKCLNKLPRDIRTAHRLKTESHIDLLVSGTPT